MDTMDRLIEGFPGQLGEALQIARGAKAGKLPNGITQVVVAGLGGSGIGANLVSELTRNHLRIPVIVCKSYGLPHWVGANTAVIISSYSGNTEETLDSMRQAIAKGCTIAAVTSNGKVAQLAEEHGLPMIRIPGGMPPRACLGYSFVQQIALLEAWGVSDSNLLDQLPQAITNIKAEQEAIRSEAKALAEWMFGKIPVLYSADDHESIAVRWRQQINENAKMLCWHHVLPEMNHNELVGWRIKTDELAVVFMRTEDEHPRVGLRAGVNQELMQDYASEMREVNARGETELDRRLYMVSLGDWLSWYLSELRGVDAVEVHVIDKLKSALANVPA